MRSRGRSLGPVAAAVAGLALASPACILAPGRPWGTVDVSLQAAFAPADARVDEAGRLRTARSYLVRVDELVASVATFTVQQAGPEGAGASFDEASPPAGYSLCHNGHCHADDGRLVPYAEIEAELAGGGEGAVRGAVVDVGADIALAATPAAVPASCADERCLLERGAIVAARLRLDAVRVTGVAFDALDPARVPADGVPFAIDVPVTSEFVTGLAAEVERFAPLRWRVVASLALGETLLDDVDFAGGVDASELSAVSARVIEGSEFTASINAVDESAPGGTNEVTD